MASIPELYHIVVQEREKHPFSDSYPPDGVSKRLTDAFDFKIDFQ